MKIQKLVDRKDAIKICSFLTGKNTFDQVWAPAEKQIVLCSLLESLDKPNHQYWYCKDGDQIVAAMGIRETIYKNLGFEMAEDYFAVHKNYRNNGIATQLLHTVEKYVKKRNGRYIHAISCDIDSYIPARIFYIKNKYQQVGAIPNYYVEGEGRIDYFKKL